MTTNCEYINVHWARLKNLIKWFNDEVLYRFDNELQEHVVITDMDELILLVRTCNLWLHKDTCRSIEQDIGLT